MIIYSLSFAKGLAPSSLDSCEDLLARKVGFWPTPLTQVHQIQEENMLIAEICRNPVPIDRSLIPCQRSLYIPTGTAKGCGNLVGFLEVWNPNRIPNQVAPRFQSWDLPASGLKKSSSSNCTCCSHVFSGFWMQKLLQTAIISGKKSNKLCFSKTPRAYTANIKQPNGSSTQDRTWSSLGFQEGWHPIYIKSVKWYKWDLCTNLVPGVCCWYSLRDIGRIHTACMAQTSGAFQAGAAWIYPWLAFLTNPVGFSVSFPCS